MKIVKILFVISLIMSPVMGLAETSTPTYSCNNNGICDKDMGETITNCEKDCFQATTLRWGTCGDKVCQETESKSSCSVDCGYPWVCGDGICGGTETDWNCPQDCPKPEIPSVYCGDKICQTTENQSSCSVDCGYPLHCGDGICSGTDTYDNCPKDCSQPTTTATTTIFGGNTGGGGGAISTTPITSTVTPQKTEIPMSLKKCGVNTFTVYNECGAGVYKNAYAQCYDGFEVTLGEETSCKPADLWNQYTKEACTNHCSTGKESGVVSRPLLVLPRITPGEDVGGGNRATPLMPLTQKPAIEKAMSVCYISDDLMQEYNRLISELQKSESNQARTEEITQKITALKRQIAKQQKECINAPLQSTPTTVSRPVPMATENVPVAVSIDRCNEVAQWENKIAYYKKLSGLSPADLKKEGFSPEEIEKILQELSLGIEKVRTQCSAQEKTPGAPRATAITGSASITETVKPVVVESGQEISSYYKARLEKAVSIKGEGKQIEELKTLRDEIDNLISNLIKSRKELEVSELDTLVKEVTVSRGEIKADDISVKTTEKKMLVNVGDRPVSVEPTESQVLIRDKGFKVNADEVTIKESILSVGGVEVKMSASEVTEKLGLAPTEIELKEENAKAVYNMKINERRKLFGFIPFSSQKTVTANAENGNKLSEQLPWYNFLTTK